ncbi:holo-ACP synthase [bacterium]|nr:holo-ACP synthase [bacterium]MBU1615092.1 holo-ACP synthase [bacterium]
MIYGVGIDIIEVKRIKEAVSCFGERFLSRVFTEGEVAYCQVKANKYQSLAARFCAKEAVIKALRMSGLSLNEIEVVSSKDRVPEIRLKGKSKEKFEKLFLGPIHLSLSHTKDHALAQVVIET